MARTSVLFGWPVQSGFLRQSGAEGQRCSLSGEECGPVESGQSQSLYQRGLANQLLDAICPRRRIVWVGPQGCAAGDLVEDWYRRADAWKTCSHGFNQGHPEALINGGQEQRRSARVQFVALVV